MQDAFLVSEPKRYFKREKEQQVFLFESNIVFTKKEELPSKKVRYVFKDRLLVNHCVLFYVGWINFSCTKFTLWSTWTEIQQSSACARAACRTQKC